MKLNTSQWDEIYSYLVYDLKLDDSRKNVQRRRSVFNLLCRHFEEVEFNRRNFVRFIQELLEKGYAKEYANTFIKLAKHIDKYYKLGELEDLSLYGKQSKIIDTLTYEQIVSMAEVGIQYKRRRAALNYQYKCLIYVLLMTGARISEIISLKWDSLKDNPECLIIEQNKTKDFRVTSIGNKLHAMLLNLPRNGEYIFHSHTGHRLDAITINKDLKRRAEAVGIEKRVYNHLLRHSFVNIMLRSGTPIHVVSRMVGHKDISTTNEYYTHIMVQEMSDYLHLYHPHLKEEQTLDVVKKRIEGFLQTFINKDKFNVSLENSNNGISLNITEGIQYKDVEDIVEEPVIEIKKHMPIKVPRETTFVPDSCIICGNEVYGFQKQCNSCMQETIIDIKSLTAEKVG